MKRLIGILAMLVLAGMLTACGASGKAEDSKEKLSVMTTFYPMYDFTKAIVGDEGEVELLIPAGTDSHDYEPSAKDMAKIQDTDIFVYNDENMETWVPAIQKTLQEGNVHTIKATEGMLLLPGSEEGHDHDHEHGEEGHTHELDPHVWLAPSLAIKQVANIRDQLIEAYPEKQEVWTKNAAAYTEKLQALHQLYQETFKQAKQRSFVTQHAAFNYLALEYGLNQVSIAGLSSSEEPSAARIAELKHFVKEHGINYIYFEENAKDSIARTLANEAGVSLEVLNPLEELTNEQIENGENYLSIMESNLEALKKTTETENPLEDTLTPKKEKSVYNGYFEDEDVQDRSLSDWAGTWQTVDTYVEDGTFDPVFEYKDQRLFGIGLQYVKEYETDPNVKIQFNGKESGPSGGLITTLEIYNQLTKKDLTKGYVIAGTGTIEEDGTIGQIGGIEHKILGAASAKADIFLSPGGENYQDAKNYVKKKKLKIKVIKVDTIQDAITQLEGLN